MPGLAIRFYGETQGWDEVKRRAADCGKQSVMRRPAELQQLLARQSRRKPTARPKQRRRTFSTKSSKRSNGPNRRRFQHCPRRRLWGAMSTAAR